MRYTFCSITIALVMSAPLRGGADEDFVVIKAGRVITVSGEEYSPGVVVIENGKISAVGGDLEYPPSAKLIRAPHETVMPGLIHPRSRFGLGKYTRSGVQGDQRVVDEVSLSQMRFDDLLEAGFVAVTFVPSGSDIPGVAATYRTAGPDDSRLLDDDSYLHVVPKWRSSGRKMLSGALKKAKAEIEKVKKAHEEWDKKQKEKAEEEANEDEEFDDENGDEGGESYQDDEGDSQEDEVGDGEKDEEEEEEEKFEPPKIDPKHQPLVDLIEKKEGARMMVAITRASDLLHLDAVMEQYEDLAHTLYLATGRSSDYHHAVESLGEREATVVLRPWVHYMPQTTFRYNLMNRLDRAGCSVAAKPRDDSREELLRHRGRVASLLRTGLSREAALKALTLNAAKAIGLDDKLGSIEKDRDADLAFFDGDPLDPHSSVTRVMILGEIVWDRDKKLAGRD